MRSNSNAKVKRINIQPPALAENQYIYRIAEAITDAGHFVNGGNLLKAIFHADIIILNWYENLTTRSEFWHFVHFSVKLFWLIIAKLLRRKIIWVAHNKQPHAKKTRYSTALMKILLQASDRIIIHCGATIDVLKNLNPNIDSYEYKIIKIPHPNYIGVYPNTENILKKDSKQIKLLFIGLVRKYKNIDLLIEVVKSLKSRSISLTIAGNCSENEEFKNHLFELASDNEDIHFDLRFIEDNEMAGLIESHDILVLPYDTKSSLNSGTIIMAFSYRKTVVSPLIGILQEYKDKSFFYSYEYQTKEEHFDKLKEAIWQVIDDYQANIQVLKEKGQIAYKLMARDNSIEVVSNTLKKALNSL